MPHGLIEIVRAAAGQRIAVLGDLMLDRYLYGNAERLSPEAPVPVLHFQHEQCRIGGAGSVAADLAALGVHVQMLGLVGADEAGREVRRQLADCGIDTAGVLEAAERPTVSKVRLIGLAQHRHPQQMIRLDYEDSTTVPAALIGRILENLRQATATVGVLCIEDYNKGLLSAELCQAAIDIARKASVPVLIDPAAIADYGKYAGATALKLNRMEAHKATGIDTSSSEGQQAAAQTLLQQLGLEAVVLTLDKHGAFLATRDGTRRWLKTRARQVYDVTGAGDMVLAMLAAARAAGANWADAVALANVAGGLEVERFGAVPVTPAEIIAELLSEVHRDQGKQRTLEALLVELAQHRACGRKIVFTNGCFDIVHLGHVKYFQYAKSQGDVLVVAVNTDRSIRKLKGDKRPIINERDRLGVLEELESIDYLILFDEDTPIPLLEKIKPDVLVKGADYRKDQVVGWQIVEGYGGRVALAPLVDGHSTSNMIQRILEAYGKP